MSKIETFQTSFSNNTTLYTSCPLFNIHLHQVTCWFSGKKMTCVDMMHIQRECILIRQFGITSNQLYTSYVVNKKQNVFLSNSNNKLKLNFFEQSPIKWGDTIEPGKYYKLDVSTMNTMKWIPVEYFWNLEFWRICTFTWNIFRNYDFYIVSFSIMILQKDD
jgi:hypothetical protein